MNYIHRQTIEVKFNNWNSILAVLMDIQQIQELMTNILYMDSLIYKKAKKKNNFQIYL